MGIQAILGTIWWICGWFVYIKNQSGDTDLYTINNCGSATIPLLWWWERISQTNGTYIWLAVLLMLTFILYGVISFAELIAWALYMDGYYDFARIWFTTVGYWGSIF